MFETPHSQEKILSPEELVIKIQVELIPYMLGRADPTNEDVLKWKEKYSELFRAIFNAILEEDGSVFSRNYIEDLYRNDRQALCGLFKDILEEEIMTKESDEGLNQEKLNS